MGLTIRKANIDDSEILASIISTSNKCIAEKFNLTRDNTPKHPSFCTKEWIYNDFERGEIYYILENDKISIGCVAYEQPDNNTAYLNRLSVIPSARNKGYGEKLVNFHLNLAREQRVNEVSIGIINKHTQLKEWYKSLGFTETFVKVFPHLPFDVCFMKIST